MGTNSNSGDSILVRLAAVNAAFRPAGPISDQDLLAGRGEQLFELIDLTTTPGAHAVIYGERGVGKTSVASVFEVIASSQGCVSARINCNVLEDFGRVWTNMADQILDVSAGTAALDVEISRAAMEAFSYSQTPSDVVRYLRKLKSHAPLVLIFDEFDVLGDATVSESFANLMKATSDLGLDVHIVIVGVAEDIDALLEGHASVARGLHQIKMPRLSDDELHDIIKRGARKLQFTFSDRVSNAIVSLSQGLPHYTHLLAQQAARQAALARRTTVEEEDWRPAIDSALSKAQQQILDLYHKATASAQKTSITPAVLHACALASKDVQGFFRPTDLVGPLSQITGKSYQIPSFVKNLASLAEADRGPALETRTFADKRKRYRFANPLLQPFVLLKAEYQNPIGPS